MNNMTHERLPFSLSKEGMQGYHGQQIKNHVLWCQNKYKYWVQEKLSKDWITQKGEKQIGRRKYRKAYLQQSTVRKGTLTTQYKDNIHTNYKINWLA